MNRYFYFQLTIGALLIIGSELTSSSLAADDKVASAEIIIQANHVIGPVNKKIFGQNIEAASPAGIVKEDSSLPLRTGSGVWNPVDQNLRSDVVGLSKEVGVRLVRYPGGCLVHGWDWKKSVGPRSEREQQLGLDEFISYCREVGAEPLIMVSDYTGNAQDASDLVEYLNAPDDGNHPWARKRAENGHASPYGIVYFELGNESDHGNHELSPKKKFTAEEYVTYFQERASAMKGVDPSIKLGGLVGTGTGPDDPWNITVLSRLKDNLDFVVVHVYPVWVLGGGTVLTPSDYLMRACMASTDDAIDELRKYRALITQTTGRNVPLAITEYNILFVQNKPIPYRFSFGPALFAADFLRALLDPALNVELANYWAFLNGYFGMLQAPTSDLVQGRAAEWKKMPAFYLFKLWAQHFGDTLVETNVAQTPMLEFEGAYRTWPRRSAPPLNLISEPAITWKESTLDGCSWTAAGAGVTLVLSKFKGQKFPVIGSLKVTPGMMYELSFEARYSGENGKGTIGVGMMDSRGWEETKSASAIGGLNFATDFKKFSTTICALPDNDELSLLWRLNIADRPLTGKLEIRNIVIKALPPKEPFAAITAASSRSKDGKKLFVIVFNKDTKTTITTRFRVDGAKLGTGRYWRVSAPSLESNNLKEETANESISGDIVGEISNDGFSMNIPAISMTALEFECEMEPRKNDELQ